MKSTAEIVEILRHFKETRSETYGIERMALFGSAARGEQREGSDIDICVKLRKTTFRLYMSLREELERLFSAKITIGGVSGCHINPAITLGCMLSGRMKAGEGLMYMLFQVAGALIGSSVLWLLTSNIDMAYATTTGANVCGAGVSLVGGERS